MRPGRAEATGVRVGPQTLVSLLLCAAAAAAALAHAAIDVVGDFALQHDAYDHIRHDSRGLVGGVAFALAALLAVRGLRACCEIAAANRTRLPLARLPLREGAAFVFVAIVASTLLVPAMEWLDGRAGGVPVTSFADAFGGSLALGLATTLLCAAAVAAALYAFAHWILSHREAIAVAVATLLRPFGEKPRPATYALRACALTLARARANYALSLSKRGPPKTIVA